MTQLHLHTQLPSLTVSEANDPNPTAYSLQLHFPENPDEKTKKFNQHLEMYDVITMKTAQERSKEWLGRPALTDAQALEFYTPLLIKSKDVNGVPDKKFPDAFRLKLPMKDGQFLVKCFDKDKQRADIKEIVQKGCYIKAIMQLNGVNLKKNAYSSSASALQIRVFPPSRLTGYSFLPDEDDDENVVVIDLPNDVASEVIADTPDEVEETGSNTAEDTSATTTTDVVEETTDATETESATTQQEASSDSEKPETPAASTTEPAQQNSDESPSPQPKRKTKFTGRGKK